jgi:hypothetical protein
MHDLECHRQADPTLPVANINAIIEATWHDNSVADTDVAPPVHLDDEVTHDQLEGVSLHDAIKWANEQTCPVILYLYDEGDGTS